MAKVEFERRKDIAGHDERVLSQVPERMAKFVAGDLGPKLGDKFSAAQQVVDQLKIDVLRLTNHEDKVEKYLAGLTADRPREGQAIQQLVESAYRQPGQGRGRHRRVGEHHE